MDKIGEKYLGIDSYGPLRVRFEQHISNFNYAGNLNPYHENPHIHIDRRCNITSGSWQKVITLLQDIFDREDKT